MPNAKDARLSSPQRLLVVGPVGSGKTQQIITLPGRKFVYVFEPNTMRTLGGYDLDYEEFLITPSEMDFTLKGFNKDSKSDKLPGNKKPEPKQMIRWIDDFNAKCESGFFLDYDWLCFESLTLFKEILMDRQMFLNNRFGDIEDRADYRIAGSKLSEIFQVLTALPINLYVTGHLNEFEDEKTKKVRVQLDIPGSARRKLPVVFTNIWETSATTDTDKKYIIKTRADPRGFQDIRTSIRGLKDIEDVTFDPKDFDESTKLYKHPENFGIGALLKRYKALPELLELRNKALAEAAAQAKGGTATSAAASSPTSSTSR